MFTDLFIDRIVDAILQVVSWLAPDYETLFGGGLEALLEQLTTPPPSPTDIVWVQEQLSLIWGLLSIEYMIILAAHLLWLSFLAWKAAFGSGDIGFGRWANSLTWSTGIVSVGVPLLVAISRIAPYVISWMNNFFYSLGTFAPSDDALQLMSLDSEATGIAFGPGLNIIVEILAVMAQFNLLLLAVLVTVGLLLSALSLAVLRIGGVGKAIATQSLRLWFIGLLGSSAMIVVLLVAYWITALLVLPLWPPLFIGLLVILMWFVLLAAPWLLGRYYNKHVHKLVAESIDTSKLYNQHMNTDSITPGRMGREKTPQVRALPKDALRTSPEWPSSTPAGAQPEPPRTRTDTSTAKTTQTDVSTTETVRTDTTSADAPQTDAAPAAATRPDARKTMMTTGDTASGETDSQQSDNQAPLRGNAPGTAGRKLKGKGADVVADEANRQANRAVARAASGDVVEGAATAAVAKTVEHTARNVSDEQAEEQADAEVRREQRYYSTPTEEESEET